MRRYTAQLSLTALVCFMGTLQSIAVTFVMEHRPSVWSIGWDMNLLAAAYAVSPLSLSLSLKEDICVSEDVSYIYSSDIVIYMCLIAGYRVIKHLILCTRSGDGEKRASVCNCFQSLDDDYCGNYGLFHPC